MDVNREILVRHGWIFNLNTQWEVPLTYNAVALLTLFTADYLHTVITEVCPIFAFSSTVKRWTPDVDQLCLARTVDYCQSRVLYFALFASLWYIYSHGEYVVLCSDKLHMNSQQVYSYHITISFSWSALLQSLFTVLEDWKDLSPGLRCSFEDHPLVGRYRTFIVTEWARPPPTLTSTPTHTCLSLFH